MGTRKKRWLAVLLLAWLLLLHARPAGAVEGQPLAVRLWPGGAASVENHWGLQVLLVPEASTAPTAEESDGRYRQVLSYKAGTRHVFSRRPNEDQANWRPISGRPADRNAVTVRSIPFGGQQASGEGCQAMLISTDGVQLLLINPDAGLESRLPSDLGPIDAVVFAGEGPAEFSAGRLTWLKDLKPRWIVAATSLGRPARSSLIESFDMPGGVRDLDHNTLAISKTGGKNDGTRLVTMTKEPWRMSAELRPLFAAMESANEASQKVFAELTAEQLNFRPTNGTHTPRWNAEHMMGRQLGFFSQIYHAVDPRIPEMDLNPKQMPPDYVAAHPDWTGAEEARQMERVDRFCRRFAYCLQGVDLDAPAPGSRWTLRGLLRQMDRHYDQHTANTIKKFSLPGWPE